MKAPLPPPFSLSFRTPANLWPGLTSYAQDLPSRMHVELRAELMVEAYRRRREHYHLASAQQRLAYDEQRIAERTKVRLARRGIQVRPRSASEPVRTLSYIPQMSWHPQLLPGLRALGPLHNFDYREHGLEFSALARRDPATLPLRRKACTAFEEYARQVKAEGDVDWIFVYANGLEVLKSTLAKVHEITGAPVVTMCLDDKQSWETDTFGEQRGGQIDLVPEFDLAWTSARIACEWYMVEGSNPIFMGEGCCPDNFQPGSEPQDIDVCFVGQGYGYRRHFIGQMQRLGMSVHAIGRGFSQRPVTDREMVSVMQRSKIILGLGGIGWSERVKNVKGRDFDAPCIGAYLTSYNPDLASHFSIGQEIACYSSPDEAVEIARELIGNPKLRRDLATHGRARCIAEHTWAARYQRILKTLGVFAA